MSPTVKGMCQLFTGAMAIGLAPVFVKLLTADSGIGPIGAGFWRMAIGTTCFGVATLLSRGRGAEQPAALSDAGVLRLMGFAGLMFALDLSAWHTSFNYTTVASSTLIANLSSVMVPICGIIFFNEPLRRGVIVGGVIAIMGVVGLTLYREAGIGSPQQQSLIFGEGLAFLTAFFYTTYMLCIKALTKTLPPGVAMLWSSAVSALVLMILSLGMGETLIPLVKSGWLWLGCLGLISQYLGQGLIARALTRLPVSRSALMLLSAPMSSAIFGWVILGEVLNFSQIVSVAITLAGIAIVAVTAKRS